MPLKILCSLLLLSLSIIASGSSSAQDTLEVGFRVGTSTTDKAENFEQYEVYASRRLPWNWLMPRDWVLGTRLNVSLGALDGGGDTGFIGALGPGLVLSKAGNPLSLNAGVKAAVLSRHAFGREDFGSHFQFVSHIGAKVEFGWNLSAGYQFQHMSNAGIDDPNPGLDLHMFELGYRF